MSDSAVAQPSLMGGVIWSRVLEPRAVDIQPVTLRGGLGQNEGCSSKDPVCWVATGTGPLPKHWLSPQDLIQTTRPYIEARASLQHLAAQYPSAFVPRGLLRDLVLEEAHASQRAMLGNRLAVSQGPQGFVIAQPSGTGSHQLSLSLLQSSGPRTTWQVAAVAEHPCAAAPIWQLSYSQASALDDLPLLAARTGHAMCIVQPGVSNERLHVQAVASARSRRRIMHWAWNPYLQQQGAFMGDDCSVTLFNLERNTLDCQPRTSFHQWQATEVAAELGAPPSAGRLVCEWAPHPTQLLTATGLRLARFDTRASEPAHTLHMRPEHDYLFALAVPGQAEDGPFDQMVAVSTARHILLLDLRRPQQPVLSWRHHQDSDPPHLLNFIPSWDLQAGQQLANKAQHPHSQPATPSLSPAQLAVGSGGGGAAEVAATQASQALHTPVSLQARDRTGPLPASSIIGASLASGQLLAYGISMCAASTGLQVRRASVPGNGAVGRSAAGSGSGSQAGGFLTACPSGIEAQACGRTSSTWRPHFSSRVQSLGSQQRVSWPLSSPHNSAALDLQRRVRARWPQEVADQQAQLPDLAGVALLLSGAQEPLLLRLTLEGDVFIEPASPNRPLGRDQAPSAQGSGHALQRSMGPPGGATGPAADRVIGRPGVEAPAVRSALAAPLDEEHHAPYAMTTHMACIRNCMKDWAAASHCSTSLDTMSSVVPAKGEAAAEAGPVRQNQQGVPHATQGSMLDSISASQLMRVVSAKQTPVTLWEVQHQLQVSATEVPSAVASDNQALLRSFYRQAVQGEAGQAARVRDVQAVLDQLLASKKRPRGHSHASQSGCPVTLRHQMVCLAGLQHRDLAREPEAAHAGPPSNCIPDSQQSMDVETSASPDQCGSLLVVPCDRLLGTGVVVHAQGNPPTVASPAPARRAIPGWAEDGGAVNQMTEGARTSLDLLRAKWTSPG